MADHAVAVYIFVHGWWIKPSFDRPVTPLESDGSWVCDITTGGSDIYATLIAALLIPATYSPPLAAGWPQLPLELDSNSVAQVRIRRPYPRALTFSGYGWSVKDSHGTRVGPGENLFSDGPSNVWIDADGRLHLRVTRDGDVWHCAEIVSDRSFGWGTYRVSVASPADALDRNLVLGLFTWSDDAPFAHRELDVEISRWGNAQDPCNAQFVVQPWDQPGHRFRFTVPPAVTTATYTLTWQTSRVDFAAHTGDPAPPDTGSVIAAWTFEGSSVPPPGGEQFRMNLWLLDTNGPSHGREEEVVINRFVFVPDRLPRPSWTRGWCDTDGTFTAEFQCEPHLFYRIERSTDLVAWTLVTTQIPLQAWGRFTETFPSSQRQRFYRLGVSRP